MVKQYEDKRQQSPDIFDKGAIITEGYDARYAFEVLKGNSAVYIAKNVIPPSECKRIVDAYFKSEHRDQYSVKPMIEKIGLPLYLAGKEHIEFYFNNAKKFQQSVNGVYKNANTINYPEFVLKKLNDFYGQHNGIARVIHYKEKDGFYGILRSWGQKTVTQNIDASPLHEDRIQIRLHKGLETQDVIHSALGSTVIYYSNGPKHGELTVYDMRVQLANHVYEKKGKGYGFTEKFIQDVKKITVKPEPGDIITFWAGRLHKVAGIKSGNRITASFFAALKPHKKECIVWS